MSYARWSNSAWYAFYNVNGNLSLWYDMEHTIDWEFEELVDIMKQDPEKIPLFFSEVYKCTIEEAKEAMGYIQMYIEDYDPADTEEYNKEVAALLNLWSKEDE
jgi:hypothetical protein